MRAFDSHSALPNSGRQAETHAERPVVFLMTNNLETGGSERQFTAVAKALPSASFEVQLGCLGRRGSFLKGIDEIAEFNAGGSFLSLKAQRSRLALYHLLRARRVAVSQSFDFYSNLMLIPTARLARVPAVIGSHRQMGDLLTPLQFGAQAAVFHLCDRVVCNSRAAADRLLDEGLPAQKAVVIPNGLPREAFVEVAPALPPVPSTLRVGMIARMNNRVKNHPLFLRVAARLALKHSGLEFVLVGDGPLRPGLERMAGQLGITSRVRFLGDRHDIPAVLASLDVTVLPSFSESLSNAILESMAAGKPVVATRVGGNPELVRDRETGLLVPPDDENRLLEALECLLLQPSLRTEYGQRARREAVANFSLERVSDLFAELYREVLAEKGWQAPRRGSGASPDSVSSHPVRVAIVAASARWIGGQGVQASSLIRHWQGDPAIEARFIPIDPELPRRLRWVERMPFLRTVMRIPFYLASLWRGVKEAEAVHIFSGSYWSFLLAPAPALLVARLLGRRALINYHSGEARDHLRHWRTALPVLKRADLLVVPSGYLVDVFREFGLDARIVPNTVDLSQFAYRPRRPLRPLLLCTRGFGPYYRVDLVVRAFAEVKERFPEARLCLVGKGPLESEVRELAHQLRLADVEFTGPVPHEDIQRFYDRSDIFVNTSCLDNMPISILEAFASGVPVASTAPKGIRYLVEHERTGLLSEPGDWRGLAANTMRLLREPDLALRLAQNAYQECQRFRWEAVRPLWLEVYRSLASCGSRGTENRVLRSMGNVSLRSPRLEAEEASLPRHFTPML